MMASNMGGWNNADNTPTKEAGRLDCRLGRARRGAPYDRRKKNAGLHPPQPNRLGERLGGLGVLASEILQVLGDGGQDAPSMSTWSIVIFFGRSSSPALRVEVRHPQRVDRSLQLEDVVYAQEMVLVNRSRSAAPPEDIGNRTAEFDSTASSAVAPRRRTGRYYHRVSCRSA
jgi:hypothetical protein